MDFTVSKPNTNCTIPYIFNLVPQFELFYPTKTQNSLRQAFCGLVSLWETVTLPIFSKAKNFAISLFYELSRPCISFFSPTRDISG